MIFHHLPGIRVLNLRDNSSRGDIRSGSLDYEPLFLLPMRYFSQLPTLLVQLRNTYINANDPRFDMRVSPDGVDIISENTRVAIINVFPLYTGTTAAVLDYQCALRDLGYDVKLYQLVFPDKRLSYPLSDVKIKGFTFLPRNLRIPFNTLLLLPRKLKNLKEEIVIIADQSMMNLRKLFPDSFVIVHDLRELSEFSESLFRRLYFNYVLRNIGNGENLIAVSEYTKSVLSLKYGLNVDINVIPLFSSIEVDRSEILKKMKNGLTGKDKINVLYLAADRPYKNIKLFLQVAKIMGSTEYRERFHFILVSRLRQRTKKCAKKMRITNLEIIEHAENIRDLYIISDILMFPSLIEGFGLPLVDAMSFGIPVLYSNRRPMTDIVGSAGIALDPLDANLWVAELQKLSEPNAYNERVAMSYVRSRIYSYDNFKNKLKMVIEKQMQKTKHPFLENKD